MPWFFLGILSQINSQGSILFYCCLFLCFINFMFQNIIWICFILLFKINSFITQCIMLRVPIPSTSPCSYLPLLPSRSTPFLSLMTKDHIDICVPCCLQKPCGSPQSMLQITLKDTGATFAVALMNANLQLRKCDIKGICDNLYSPTNLPPLNNNVCRK